MCLDISRCGRYCISRCLHVSLVCFFKDDFIHRWGLQKKQEVIYCSRRLLLVHETHGHLLQGIASGRKKVFMVSWKYKNVGQFDLPSAFVLNNT